MSSKRGQGGLSNAITFITMSFHVWKIGDKISAMLKKAGHEKEMAKIALAAVVQQQQSKKPLQESGPIEKKIPVQWQSASGQIRLEYSISHSVF